MKRIIMNWTYNDRLVSRNYEFPYDALMMIQEFVNLLGNRDVNNISVFRKEMPNALEQST